MEKSFQLLGLLADERTFVGTRALIPDALKRRAERQQEAEDLGSALLASEVVVMGVDSVSD